jgi:mono/diheme cytochrome c family protein
MTKGRRRTGLGLGLGFLAFPLLLRAAPEPPPANPTYLVTPVEGRGWLKRLSLTRELSAMGQMGSTRVHPTSAVSAPWGKSSFPQELDQPFTLTGADLYRIDCQACHNVEGIGTPPEIRSLIDAVRATSPDFIRAQMAKRGMNLAEPAILEMTSQANAALRERLQKGGDKMPPFAHLQGAEIDALFDYLARLAGLPALHPQPVHVTERAARVGEHLVKGTCLICHDATGPGRDAMATSTGLVPSLASFPEQNSVLSVVRKVRQGAPAPGAMGLRGEMPVLSYLTAEEIKAAYLYLTLYPPR